VIPIPGPSAVLAAVSASGLPTDEFMFLGFLPPKKSARREKLLTLADMNCTLVFYEAPHRIEEMLEDLQALLGDRAVFVAREITKIHEESFFGRLSEVRPLVTARGEFVVVLGGATETQTSTPATREEVLKKLGMTRNELYDLFFKKQKTPS
jgi:16S rRNA (cytidine1402-2'-O)-methyltransferase